MWIILTNSDRSKIAELFHDWKNCSLVGVTWSLEQVLNEVMFGKCLGWIEDELKLICVFNKLDDNIEILFWLKRKSKPCRFSAAFDSMKAVWPGLKQLWLEVSNDNNAAKSLYLLNGFKQVGLRKKYYSNGSDAILMTRNFED